MLAPLTLLLAIGLLTNGHHRSYAHSSPEESTPNHWQPHLTNSSSSVRKRESPSVNFTWKTTSKPKFVTSKMQKVEPILTVYPPDVVYRNGRSRELVLQAQQQPNGLKRVIYYATLPEISRYVPPVTDRRYTTAKFGSLPLHQPVPLTQQRSYDPNKAGKDFVTRVQSTVIDVRPRGDKKKDYHSPSFTIIDANPTYPDAYDRIAILNGGGIADGKDKYGVIQGYGGNGLVEHVPPYQSRPINTPYSMSPNVYYNVKPYHSAEMQKLVAIPGVAAAPLVNNHPNLYTTYTASNFQNPPPYPTRHNRFPTDRYSPGSPLAAILGVSPPRPGVEVAGAPHRFQQSIGLEGPSTTSNWVPTSSLELNDNLGPSTFDHSSLDFGNPSLRPLSYKNKFATHLDPYNTGSPFGQKYTDFGTFNTDFSMTPNTHSSFKPHFSQVSDWLTNKPSLDLSTFELEDFNNALASNAAASGQESSSSVPTSTDGNSASLNGGTDMFNDMNNTIITPYLASFPNTSSIESQDD